MFNLPELHLSAFELFIFISYNAMEVLAAVASVAGVLSLTVQGIEIIGKLKIFCADFKSSDKVAADFVHDLIVLGTLLGSVKALCIKMNVADFSQKPDFHLTSMQIQIEDCTHDLEKWFALASRYERDIPYVSDEKKKRSGLSARATFKAFIAAVQKESRVAVRTRFGWHMENIQASLSLLGRELDLLHTQALQLMDNKMENLSETLQRHSKSQDEQLEGLLSSGSSNLAISVSNEERLKNIQCMMTDLIETISEKSSQTGSGKKSKSTGKSVPEPMDIRSSAKVSFPAASGSLQVGLSRSEGASSLSELEQYGNLDLQISLLSESTKMLARETAQGFPPAVSEYVLTFCALRTWNVFFPASLGNRDRNAAYDKKIEAGRRICYLREICQAENFEEWLDLVDFRLGVGTKEIENCEELAAQKLIDESRSRKTIIGNTDHDLKSTDKTTRINEWLLAVLQAKKNETGLHKAIVQNFTRLRDQNSTDDSFEKEWPRLALKYWFQDHAGEFSRIQPTSTIGSVSDQTVLQIDYTDETENFSMHHIDIALERSVSGLEEFDLSRTPVMLLQPDVPLMDTYGYVPEDEDPSLLDERWYGPKLTDMQSQ